MLSIDPANRRTRATRAPIGARLRLILAAGAIGVPILIAGCGNNSSAAHPADTTTGLPLDSGSTESTAATTTAPPTTGATASTAAPTTAPAPTAPSTTAPTTSGSSADSMGDDEGQDTPTINDWAIDVDSAECEVSDLPGAPGGEAAVPASWAAGNAEYVQFVVDGDLRPANMARDVRGTGNIQVPCNPELNDGHEVIIVAYPGPPGDPGDPVEGPRLFVTTTATVDNGQ